MQQSIQWHLVGFSSLHIIEHNKNMAESEKKKTALAFTMYDIKLSTTDTLYYNEKRTAYRVLVGTPEEGKKTTWKTWM